MDNNLQLKCIASDLKRVSLGIHRGSSGMSDRFTQEAKQRCSELDKEALPSYICKLLDDLDASFSHYDDNKRAEMSLMCSTLFQNYVVAQRDIKR